MSCNNVPMKMPVAKFPTCAGWLRRSSSAGSLLNQPSVVSSATSAPSTGVHHQRLHKATITATTTKKTGPGGNFGYAGSPDSHCIQFDKTRSHGLRKTRLKKRGSSAPVQQNLD